MTQRIVYIVPARLGDAIMTTPVVYLLKQYRPDASIDILAVTPLGASVFANNPHVDKVYDASKIEDLAEFGKRYQQCVLTHVDHRTLACAQALNIDILQAEDADQQQAQARQSLKFIHRSHDNSIVFEDINYQLFPNENDLQYIRQTLQQALPDYQHYHLVGCHIGCHGIAKSSGFFRKLFKKKAHGKVWPLQHFVKLEKLLQETDPKIRLVITGGQGEMALAKDFMKHSNNAINLCGKTSTLQLAELMNHLNCYISSDTGAMHVACAMRANLIGLFGPSNLTRTGPYPLASFRYILKENPLINLKPETVANYIQKHIFERT